MHLSTFVVLLLCLASASVAIPVNEDVGVIPSEAMKSETSIADVTEVKVTGIPGKDSEPISDAQEVNKKPEVASVPAVEEPSSSLRGSRNLGAFDSNDVDKTPQDYREDVLLQKLNTKCSKRDVASCVMLKMVSYMNRLLKKSDIEVLDGVHITQTAGLVETYDDIPRGLQDEESQLNYLLVDRLWNFVRSRSLKWSVLPDADIVVSANPDDEGILNLGMSIRTARALETGRGKMKNMGGLIAIAAAKIGMIAAIAFKALVLLVGKALLVSKIALLLAGILWIKKLFSGGHGKHVTYEVVAHPHHTSSHVSSGDHHDSYSSGWGRSESPHHMAYSAYAPNAGGGAAH